jgi:hypothetical protein
MKKLLITGALLGLAACTSESQYVGDGGLYQVALTESTPAAFTAGEDSIYIVEQRVPLQIRQPTQTELDDLRKGVSMFKNLPFNRLPWVGRMDLPTQVDFTLSSLDDKPRQVSVILNGFNEFDEYQPGVHVIDKKVQVDYSQWERTYELAPKERLSRTIREEELDEAAVDLATAVNGAPNANEVVYFENKSGSDPRSDSFTPKVVPGLAGFRIGIRASKPGKILLEASVRVRDVGARLTDQAQHAMQIHPMLFTPMVVEAP